MSKRTDQGSNPQQLTGRQRQVLALIADRLTIKEIAAQLEVTESAVNQRIKTLKERLGVNTQRELATLYQSLAPEESGPNPSSSDCSETACSNNQLLHDEPTSHPDDRAELLVQIGIPGRPTIAVDANWASRSMPQVVPGGLNGPSATFYRTGFVLGLVLLMLSTVIVAFVTAQVLSEFVGG